MSDDGAIAFSAPHYTNPKNFVEPHRRFPTSYTKSSKPVVGMKFEVTATFPDGESHTVTVKASSIDGVGEFPPQTWPLQQGENVYVYDPKPASGTFPDEIRFYGPGIGTFPITWEVSYDGGDFTKLAVTPHRIYLTAGLPACSQGNRETFFYYACNQPNGDPGTSGKDVTHMIYDDFASRTMMRINHETGVLYGPPLEFAERAGGAGILVSGWGVCMKWSRFFRDVLGVHAFPSQQVDLDTIGIKLPVGGGGGTTFANQEWLVRDQVIPRRGAPTPGPLGINTGQGGGHKRTSWPGHTIAMAFDEYYDPSYGLGPCPTKIDYENDALSGWSYVAVNLYGSPSTFYVKKDGISRLNYTVIP